MCRLNGQVIVLLKVIVYLPRAKRLNGQAGRQVMFLLEVVVHLPRDYWLSGQIGQMESLEWIAQCGSQILELGSWGTPQIGFGVWEASKCNPKKGTPQKRTHPNKSRQVKQLPIICWRPFGIQNRLFRTQIEPTCQAQLDRHLGYTQNYQLQRLLHIHSTREKKYTYCGWL